jgi:hypothetical protein
MASRSPRASIGSLLTDLQLLESLGLGFASIEDDIGPEVDGGFYTHIRALARFGDLVAAARREERDAGDAAPVRKRGARRRSMMRGGPNW